jgi:hypothetical protein
VSDLRSALEGYRAETLSELPDARIEEDFAELHRAWELLDLERMRRLAEIDRRGLYARDGHLSSVQWLGREHRIAPGTAKEHLRVARALEHMPVTRSAVESGELSMSAARILVQARDADPVAFEDAESNLVESARIHSTGDLRRIAAYWREVVEGEQGVGSEEKLEAQRRLHASVTFLGMVKVDALLDPETGEILLTVLGAVVDSEARSGEPDGRTPAQRRHDALREVLSHFLDSGDRPTVAGERPHVTVTMDVYALRGEPGGKAELEHVGPVDPATARRIACDASITRVVMAGGSEPLDVGRRTPVISPAQRRAVVVRDRHCQFPGCDRPAPWCDVHHIVAWEEGGPTDLGNLILMCRPHHRLLHRRHGFRLELDGGIRVFRRPDRTVLEARPPP